MVGEDVEELVDRVLAGLPSGLSDACDRGGILAGERGTRCAAHAGDALEGAEAWTVIFTQLWTCETQLQLHPLLHLEVAVDRAH